jgi:hypothetical protein
MYRHWYSVPTGTPRNAGTSCTVHRRSAVTACSLLLCVTFDHRFPRLEPNSLSQPFRFLTSHHRHLWRSCNPRCGSARLPLSRAERCQRSLRARSGKTHPLGQGAAWPTQVSHHAALASRQPPRRAATRRLTTSTRARLGRDAPSPLLWNWFQRAGSACSAYPHWIKESDVPHRPVNTRRQSMLRQRRAG